MKKLLILLFAVILIASCTSPQFIVTNKNETYLEDSTCIIDIKPINKAAAKLKDVSNALVNCEEYKIGDTIKLNRKEFTNY